MAVRRDTFWADHWDRKRRKLREANKAGVVLCQQVCSRIQVAAPYHEAFPPRARELGGRYKNKTQQWSFPATARRLVRELLIEIYGEDNIIGLSA